MSESAKPPAKLPATRRRRGPYAKSEDRRRVIVDAAMGQFAAGGYRATSMRDIAAAADLSLSTLRHHFPAKEELLLATLQRRDEVGMPGSTGLDGVEFLAFVVERARANTELRGLVELYTVVCAEATTRAHPGADYFVERFALLRAEYRDHFCRLAEQGRLRPGVDPERTATSLVALWDGLQLQWLLEPERVDVAAHLADHLELITQPTPSGAAH